MIKAATLGKVVPGTLLTVSLGAKLPPGTSGSGGYVLGIIDAIGLATETHEDNNGVPSAPLP